MVTEGATEMQVDKPADAAAAPAQHTRRVRPRSVVRALHTDSDSGSVDAGSDGSDAEAGPSVEAPTDGAGANADGQGQRELSRLELVQRRLGRTRRLLQLYEGSYWHLVKRLREHHRRYAIRSGHPGTKESATAVAARNEALGVPSACLAAGCAAKPMPLARFCFAHILQDPQQCLYSPGPDGQPVLRLVDPPAPPPSQDDGAQASGQASGGGAEQQVQAEGANGGAASAEQPPPPAANGNGNGEPAPAPAAAAAAEDEAEAAPMAA